MGKVLMVATVSATIGQFNISNIQLLQNMGHEVHIACNFEDYCVWNASNVENLKNQLRRMGVHFFQIPFSRSPYQICKHLKAYRELLKIMRRERYEFIHCHTPIASAIGRLAAHAAGVKVIYTAHGFHFFQGAPLMNWILYYPIEKHLAKYTDVLILINREDFELSQRKLQAKKIEHVYGVGINTDQFVHNREMSRKKRQELGIAEDTFIYLSIGELNANKNHKSVIRAMRGIKGRKFAYLICGIGDMREELLREARESGIEDRIFLLGFRGDVEELYSAADIFVFPSYREGLSVALMEAMASEMPVLCSNIRGNRELVEEGRGGMLFSPDDEKQIGRLLEWAYDNRDCLRGMGIFNRDKILGGYGMHSVNTQMKNIYNATASEGCK